MPEYIALLGNTPSLSFLELEKTLDSEAARLAPHLAAFSLDSDDEAVLLQENLGGVFKIARLIASLDLEDPEKQIATLLQDQVDNQDKITFSVTSLPGASVSVKLSSIKKLLSAAGFSARYIEGEEWGLSAAVTAHKEKIYEYFSFQKNGQEFLAEVVAVQDLDEWVKRDRQKPYYSGRKGMLPPKLARIMVNLGLGFFESQTDQPPVLYDPFCGSGTILMEAVLRGCEIIGSDLDREAVTGTETNLDWLAQEYEQVFTTRIFQADVMHAPEFLGAQKIDLIVTEPFLGKPNPSKDELDNVFTGLEGLFLGAFKTWLKLLKKGSIIVIVFPFVELPEQKYDLSGIIDNLKGFGYTLLVEPLEYYRQRADVKRQIMIFRYQ